MAGHGAQLTQRLITSNESLKSQSNSNQGPRSTREQRVHELRDAIKRGQDTFLMEEILAPNTARTPRKRRRPRSSRKERSNDQSSKKSLSGKDDYCTAGADAPPVNPFEGQAVAGPTIRTVPSTARGCTGESAFALAGGSTGAATSRRHAAVDGPGWHNNSPAARLEDVGHIKANEQSIEADQDQQRSPKHQGSRTRVADDEASKQSPSHLSEDRTLSRSNLAQAIRDAEDCVEVPDQGLHSPENRRDEHAHQEAARDFKRLNQEDGAEALLDERSQNDESDRAYATAAQGSISIIL